MKKSEAFCVLQHEKGFVSDHEAFPENPHELTLQDVLDGVRVDFPTGRKYSSVSSFCIKFVTATKIR